MPDQVLATHPIWMFGKRFDFNIYQVMDGGARVALDPVQMKMQAGAPVRAQKNQIVMHFTAGNGPASGTLGWWNTMAARPKFFCPKWDEENHHFGQETAGDCPSGHGHLRAHFGGAHYVVETARHRLNAADRYVDCIEICDTDTITWHGEAVNDNSIGIEHANTGTSWNLAFLEPGSFTGAGAARRPTDRNKWLRTPAGGQGATSNLGNGHEDFQAYQEEQYLAMILLLRHLCIKHRIARRFLGDTTQEKMSRFWHNLGALQNERRSRLMRFRGILSHMN